MWRLARCRRLMSFTEQVKRTDAVSSFRREHGMKAKVSASGKEQGRAAAFGPKRASARQASSASNVA